MLPNCPYKLYHLDAAQRRVRPISHREAIATCLQSPPTNKWMIMRRMTTIIAVSLQRELTLTLAKPSRAEPSRLPPILKSYKNFATIRLRLSCMHADGCNPVRKPLPAAHLMPRQSLMRCLPIQNRQVPPSHTVPALNLAGDCQHRLL